jgi:hypothetical protein
MSEASPLEKFTIFEILVLERQFAFMHSSYTAWRNWLIFRILRISDSMLLIVTMRTDDFRACRNTNERPCENCANALPEPLLNELADFIRFARAAIPNAASTDSVFLAECGRPLKTNDVKRIISEPGYHPNELTPTSHI